MTVFRFTRSENNQCVHLIPDTGRHFLFFGLDSCTANTGDDASTDELRDNLKSIAANPNFDNWKPSAKFDWLMYRLTTDWNEREGVMVSISTDAPSFDSVITSHDALEQISIDVETDEGETYGKIEFALRTDVVDTKDVDLFVDLGNTRLMALVSHEPTIDEEDSELEIYPVHFVPEFWTYDDWLNHSASLANYRVADSSLVLRHPQFGGTRSPAVIGGGIDSNYGQQSSISRLVPLNADQLLFLSSPKRFTWDRRRIDWMMQSKELNDTSVHSVDSLFDHIPSEEMPPQLEKRHAITFLALGIIEATYRQLNSCWKMHWLGANVRKSIKNVFLTFPSSWTTTECENFNHCWNFASKLFALNHRNVPTPKITRELDEATAAQIPFAFCSRRVMGVENWIQLYGRDNGLRVLNIDIGGGTTDISVMHYSTPKAKSQVFNDLRKPERLYRGSLTLAGDSFIEHVIKDFLIEELFNKAFITVVGQERQAKIAEAKEYLKTNPRELIKLTNCVFVPIVYLWLEKYDKTKYGNRVEISLNELSLIQGALLSSFLRTMMGDPSRRSFDLAEIKVSIRSDQIRACVNQKFGKLANLVSKLTADWDCDLVFLSGKPTEIIDLQNLFKEKIPLTKSRIIFASDFDFGNWYPKQINDQVDAKSLVVVGAALYHYDLFPLEVADDGQLIYEWFIRPRGDKKSGQNDYQLEFDKNDECFVQGVPLRSTILRRLCGFPDEELVYKLETETPGNSRQRVDLHIKKNASELTLLNGSEGSAGVRLQVNTLPKRGFWKDDPDFF